MDQASDDDEVLEPVVKQADYLSKCGFPELELDMQPNALIPHAMKCIQKHNKKYDALLKDMPDEKLNNVQHQYSAWT